MTEREIMVQALRSCSRAQCSDCLYRGNGIACKKKLMAAAADELEGGISRSDSLATWGFLQTLKDILEQKARDASARSGDIGPQVAGSYLKTCEEISALQNRLCMEVEETV